MFYQTFLSPRVKRSAFISNIHGIYKLPREFAEGLKKNLRILRKIKVRVTCTFLYKQPVYKQLTLGM